jgi:hypothetical protein
MSVFIDVSFNITICLIIFYFSVVHYSLSFLVSWTYSCDDVRQALYSSPKFVTWLKRLTLEAPEVCFNDVFCFVLLFLRE